MEKTTAFKVCIFQIKIRALSFENGKLNQNGGKQQIQQVFYKIYASVPLASNVTS
jgi:hypothetical protein